MVKTTSVFTDDVHQCVERDYDATAGGYAYTSFAEPDCDLGELFAEQEKSPIELIKALEKIVTQLMKAQKLRFYARYNLAELLDACAGGEETEFEII